jgi:hypothetical protein
MRYIICGNTSKSEFIVKKPRKFLWITFGYITIKTHRSIEYVFDSFQKAKTALEEKARMDYTNYLLNKKLAI